MSCCWKIHNESENYDYFDCSENFYFIFERVYDEGEGAETLLPIFYQQFAVTNAKRRPGTFTWFGVTNIERVWKKEGAETLQ